MEKIYYDYSVGLDAPFWIKEIRTPRGRLIWTFSSPMELSFFFIFAIVAFVIIRLFPVLWFLGSLRFVLLILAPLKVAKLYVNYQPDGKKMHAFLVDFLIYVFSFVLKTKGIYQGNRVMKKSEKVVFEKVRL